MEDKIEKKAKDLAKKLKSEILSESDAKFDEMMNKIKELSDQLTEREASLIKKVYTANDVLKDVSKLKKEEKFGAWLKNIMRGDLESAKAISETVYNDMDRKALSEGTAADGGNLVPQDFYRQLVTERVSQDNMRNKVTVVQMKTNVLTIPKHETGPEVYWTGEGETKTTTTADFSQPTITAYKLAAILYATDELIDDAAFNIIEIMTRKFADKLQEAEDTAIIAGTGVAQPTGIFTNATVGTRACAGNLDFDDIIDLIYDLDQKYRNNAQFIVHNNNVRELRKLKDNDGRYLWQDPVAQGQPATIYGYPVITTYKCAESQIAFGDYKEGYWLGDRQRMTVKISQDTTTAFTQDKTAIRVVQRIGGDVIQPLAIRKLITIP